MGDKFYETSILGDWGHEIATDLKVNNDDDLHSHATPHFAMFDLEAKSKSKVHKEFYWSFKPIRYDRLCD